MLRVIAIALPFAQEVRALVHAESADLWVLYQPPARPSIWLDKPPVAPPREWRRAVPTDMRTEGVAALPLWVLTSDVRPALQ